ncbi:LADA_0F07668g1_1 [Lachancea dasiensis]|uniref:Ribonuclease P/MRP protein subunit POP5 n=1 Tax=Lachancea dasiensis TaxID=1072105 RepID=A0A1G4JKE4_9SACH|nr:LADA_0F07668g1_1 [Lachancea dasiensis]
MVRLKSRYILFEVLYPAPDCPEERPFSNSRKDILIRHHRASPAQISHKTIIQELRRTLQHNFGDYGIGRVNSLLQIKYFSNRTSTGIIRCSREEYDLVLIALMFINRIDDVEGLVVNPTKVSGTIKRVEQYAIRRNERLLAVIKGKQWTDDFNELSDDDAQD